MLSNTNLRNKYIYGLVIEIILEIEDPCLRQTPISRQMQLHTFQNNYSRDRCPQAPPNVDLDSCRTPKSAFTSVASAARNANQAYDRKPTNEKYAVDFGHS